MKKSIILAAFFSLFILGVTAQSDYKSAIGGRLGVPLSFSYKHFITKAGALEGNAGLAHDRFGFNYFRLGGMYQHHFPIGTIPGFKWYVGGGVFLDLYQYDDFVRNNHSYSKTALGLNAVGGVDYKFKTIPLNLSVDWMPVLFLGRGDHPYKTFRASYGAFSVRYVLK